MKFVELPAIISDKLRTPIYINPALVVGIFPMLEAENRCLIQTLAVRGQESERYELEATAAEVVRLLEGRPSPEAEAAQREAEEKDAHRRAKAEMDIRALFGWPSRLGSMEAASTDLLERVAASQLEYDNGYDAWDSRQRRRAAEGLPRESRPKWEFEG